MTTILLVEDDEINQDLISRQLKWEGFKIILASDGLQAVQLAQSERPDLILMDMGLPILTGWQATARIKANPALRSIPVIALTAFAMAEDRERCFAAGCDAFETKPINFQKLIGIIQRLLAEARSAEAN
jgi:two-component system cell cycle response regulator DivK